MPTDGDGGEFASGKLREFVQGEIKENEDLLHHTGVVEPESRASAVLSELGRAYEGRGEMPAAFKDTRAARIVRQPAATDHVGSQIPDLSTFAVGLTEQDVEISEAQALSKIARSILNERAPYTALIFGGMNKGKTGFAGLWLELWKELVPIKYGIDESVVLTNMRSLEAADYVVTDIQEFKRLAFGDDEYIDSGGAEGTPPEIDPSVPKWWHFDECSTHLDARTNAHELSTKYLPLVKRFAKVNMDSVQLGHSGMDIHADFRRATITTEFIFKTGLKTAAVYASMYEDQGSELKYVLKEIPDTAIEYDPDDYSPWSWE